MESITQSIEQTWQISLFLTHGKIHELRVYGITVVKTDIIASTAASLSWFTSDNNCQDLQIWHYCPYRQRHIVFDVTLTYHFQFVHTENNTRWDQRYIVCLNNKYIKLSIFILILEEKVFWWRRLLYVAYLYMYIFKS